MNSFRVRLTSKMTSIYYFYSLPLLYLLLIIDWTHAASLRSLTHSPSKWTLDHRQPSLIVDTEVTTLEPVLFRRRPILISSERRRRRQSEDDEEEIPINEPDVDLSTNSSMISNTSTVVSDDTLSENSTLEGVKNSSLEHDLDVINQTNEFITTANYEEISNDNNTTIEQSNFSSTASDEVIDGNSTASEILPTDEKNDTNIDNLTTMETPISITQVTEQTSTMDELMSNTTIAPATTDGSENSTDSETEIPQEYITTIISEGVNSTTDFNETQNDTISIEEAIDNTTITSNMTRITTEVTDLAIDNVTIISDTAQNGTEVTDQEINDSTTISNITQSDEEVTGQGIDGTTMVSDDTQNDTSTVVDESDGYSKEMEDLEPTKPTKSVCDQSCQCLRKCHYGFEIINGTCQCDAPCKNYQCFVNDTCSVLKTGQPVCKPEKGFEHDRPFRCYQPRDAGYHNHDVAYYNRWHYNADQDTCYPFVYRGMGGNENNFQTLHECHLECITCAPSPARGSCLGYLPMWYYDFQKNQCSQFTYSGCKGNENKFLRKQECIDTCITRIINL